MEFVWSAWCRSGPLFVQADCKHGSYVELASRLSYRSSSTGSGMLISIAEVAP